MISFTLFCLGLFSYFLGLIVSPVGFGLFHEYIWTASCGLERLTVSVDTSHAFILHIPVCFFIPEQQQVLKRSPTHKERSTFLNFFLRNVCFTLLPPLVLFAVFAPVLQHRFPE